MLVVFRTRETTWGGGEVFLLGIAEEALASGHNVIVMSPAESALESQAARLGMPTRLQRANRPDVVVANDFRSLWQSTMRWPLCRRISVVHGWWQVSEARMAFSRLTRAKVCAISGAVRDAIAQSSMAPRSVEVLRMGADLRYRPPKLAERRDARAMFNCGPDERIATCVARYQDVKRVPLFLDAVTAARISGILVTPESAQTLPEFEERARIESWFAEHGETTIRWVPGCDPLFAYWAGDLAVCTSVFESLGIALLEACSVGLPIVSTAVGAPPEVLARSAVHLSPRSTQEELAIQMLRVLQSPELRHELRLAAQEVVSARSVRATWAQMERLCG